MTRQITPQSKYKEDIEKGPSPNQCDAAPIILWFRLAPGYSPLGVYASPANGRACMDAGIRIQCASPFQATSMLLILARSNFRTSRRFPCDVLVCFAYPEHDAHGPKTVEGIEEIEEIEETVTEKFKSMVSPVDPSDAHVMLKPFKVLARIHAWRRAFRAPRRSC